jgi:hypothetical protein
MLSAGTFPCPNCHEFISAGVTQCRHCSTDINPHVAEGALRAQEKINMTVEDARWVRYLVGVMWGFYIFAIFAYSRLGPLNIVSLICVGLGLVAFAIIPVLLVLWKKRYRGVQQTTSITNVRSELGRFHLACGS